MNGLLRMKNRQDEDDNLIAVFEDELYKVNYEENEKSGTKLNMITPNFFTQVWIYTEMKNDPIGDIRYNPK